ncbi:MAG: esterase-like activity of phytase family protein [Psychroflexus maritimus]
MTYLSIKFNSKYFLLIAFLFLLSSCSVTKKSKNPSLKFNFLDEYVIPAETYFNDEEIGGLSGVDYVDGKLFLVDDRSSKPIIYEAGLQVNHQQIDSLVFIRSFNLKKTDRGFQSKALDLESIRYKKGNFWLSSEGYITGEKNPSIFQIDDQGKFLSEVELPSYYQVGGENQPRNNGVFEALSVDLQDSNLIWTATELPLKEDGKTPILWNRFTPVRFSQFNITTGQIEKEFAYSLDRVVKWPLLPFVINGVTEILAYQNNRFLVLERAFSAGRGEKSNRVKLFLVDFSEADSSLSLEVLNKELQLAEKELVLDFKKIRRQLPSKIIDNIEGMCFGPKLTNGNRSLLLISDNNFNSFGDQITQLIWLEMIED